MPKIYTKKGDEGYTSLYDNTRVSKSDPICHALGNIDELQACIGQIISFLPDEAEQLRNIQRHLIDLSSDLATSPDSRKYEHVQFAMKPTFDLENRIDEMESYLPKLTKFILCGTSFENACIHLCRSKCRQVERYIANIEVVNIRVLCFINRLSDYFFVLSRMYTEEHNEEEIPYRKSENDLKEK